MGFMRELDAFLRSEPVLQFWQRFNLALPWISLPLIAIALWLFVSTDRKYEKRRGQLKKELHFPGMEWVRDFLKPFLKKHNIESDGKQHERN